LEKFSNGPSFLFTYWTERKASLPILMDYLGKFPQLAKVYYSFDFRGNFGKETRHSSGN